MKKVTMFIVGFTMVTGLTLSAAEKQWEKLTDFQKRLTPRRLNMMEADYSGKPLPADVKFLADRLTIINHVTAYSFLIDEGRWDQWYKLFSDDIIFETTTPGFGTIKIKGKKAFRKFNDVRFLGPGSENNRVAHRHTMGNVHIAEQTDKTAEVRTYMLISNAFPDGKFEVFTSGTYNASLEKRNGRWVITRWYIEVDSMAPPSEIPDIPGIEFIPDNNSEKNNKEGDSVSSLQVETIKQFKYLYNYGDFFISGQPSIKRLEWLKSQGVSVIVNLRTEEENKQYTEQAYDERETAEKMGFTYYSLPVDGIEGYTPENLQSFIQLIEPGKKIVVQCATAHRATDFLMGYLIKKEGMSANDAVNIGQQMRMVVPLANLIGSDFDVKLKK